MINLKPYDMYDSKTKTLRFCDFQHYVKLNAEFEKQGWTIIDIQCHDVDGMDFKKSKYVNGKRFVVSPNKLGTVRITVTCDTDDCKIVAVYGSNYLHKDFAMYQLMKQEEQYLNEDGNTIR